jgi:hypothetical protein
MNAETMAVVKTQLADRIDILAREASHLTTSRIVHAVDDIRREARACRLDALATLASGLERALATSGGDAVVLPYLEAMSDALDCATMPKDVSAAFLASVGVRLYG